MDVLGPPHAVQAQGMGVAPALLLACLPRTRRPRSTRTVLRKFNASSGRAACASSAARLISHHSCRQSSWAIPHPPSTGHVRPEETTYGIGWHRWGQEAKRVLVAAQGG